MSQQDHSTPDNQTDDTSYEAWLKGRALPEEAGTIPRKDLGLETDGLLNEPGLFYGWAKLLIVLVPLLFLVGYYTYSSVSGATFFGVTLRTNTNLENGLLVHWTFDGPDMTATTTLDVSGNNKNGLLINDPLRIPGKIGQALHFNGINQRITAEDGGTMFTAWIKPDVLDEEYIFQTYNSQILLKADGRIKIIVDRVISDAMWTTNNSVISLGEWNFVAIDISARRIYINGNEVSLTQDAAGGGPPAASSGSLFVGDNSSSVNPYTGSMDDFRIYSRVLSDREIEMLYNLGEGSKVNITQNPTNLQTGLVAHFTFDGPDMDWSSSSAEAVESVTAPTSTPFACGTDTVLDSDSNVYNTLQIGSQCWMKQNMRVGTRISAATTQTNNSTIEKWCYDNTDSNCTSNNPNYPDGGLYQWNEAMQYSTTEGTRGICPAGWHVPTDTEFYVMENYLDSTVNNPSYSGYRGTDIGTKLKPGGASGLEFNMTGEAPGLSTFTGRGTYSYIWTSTQEGGGVYNRNISSGSAQVWRDYDGKSFGFVVRCIQDTSTTPTPIRGNAVNMNNGNATIGKIGQALNFDGVDDYLDLGSSATFDDMGNMSFCSWIKPGSIPNAFEASIFAKNEFEFLLKLDGPQATLDFYRAFSTGYGYWHADPRIQFNVWTHVCVTYSSGSVSNDPVFYINGVPTTLTEEAAPSDTAVSDEASTLEMGKYGFNEYFDGPIDDARVYNRILSADEVEQLYQIGLGSTVNSVLLAAGTPPDTPTGLNALWSCGLADFSWVASNSATSYQLRVYIIENHTWFNVGNVTSYSSPETFFSGNLYHVDLRAVNSYGFSSSTSTTFTVPFEPPEC